MKTHTSSKTEYFFVSSANGDGTNEACTLMIPDGMFECANDEYMIVTLEQHQIQNTLYNVTEGKLVIGGATATIPSGFYSLPQLQRVLNGLNIGTFSFSCTTNTWTISTPAPTTLTLSTDMQRLLGLPAETAIGSTTVTGKQAIGNLHNELIIKLSDLSLQPLNITNIAPLADQVTSTNIIGIIPMTASPGCLNVFTNQNGTFQARVFGADVGKMTVSTSDLNGELITGLPPWTAVFRIDTHKMPGEDLLTAKLDSIIGILKYIYHVAALTFIEG